MHEADSSKTHIIGAQRNLALAIDQNQRRDQVGKTNSRFWVVCCCRTKSFNDDKTKRRKSRSAIPRAKASWETEMAWLSSELSHVIRELVIGYQLVRVQSYRNLQFIWYCCQLALRTFPTCTPLSDLGMQYFQPPPLSLTGMGVKNPVEIGFRSFSFLVFFVFVLLFFFLFSVFLCS